MPKIREYESGYQSSGRGLSETGGQSLGTIQMESRAKQGVIDATVNTGETIYKRAAQVELSDLNAKFAEARAEWQTRIDDDVRNGNIDTEKIQREYEDFVYKMNEGVSTSEGRSFFERQSASLKGYVLKNAARGQAAVAGERAVRDWTEKLGRDESTLQINPDGFEDIYRDTIDSINDQAAIDPNLARMAEKFKAEVGNRLAENALRGYAKKNPYDAQARLDGGDFNEYLNGDQRAQAQGYINAQKVAIEVEKNRAETQAKKAQEKASEAWQQSALPKLVDGSLKTQDILDSKMPSNDKIRWLKLAEEAAKDQAQGDPRVFNEMVRRSVLPDSDPQKIRGIGDMVPYVGKGLSIEQAQKVNNFIRKTPEGQYDEDNRKRLLDFAYQSLVSTKGSILGMKDPDAEYNLSQYVVALQRAEDQMRKDGKDPGLLYDPTSKDYFGTQISKYKLSSQEIMRKIGEQMSAQTRQLPPPRDPSPMASAAPGGQLNQPQEDMVRVMSKDGKSGKIPRSQLPAAIKQGYREI